MQIQNQAENRAALIWILFLIFLPVFLAFLYVFLFGVNGVFGDQWNIVYLFQKLSTGRLTLADLFTQHNEHRIFFPLLCMLLLAEVTHYNNVVEMYSIVALFTASWAMLIARARRQFHTVPGGTTRVLIPFSFLMFTWRQSTNMLAGFQITYAFVQTFGLISVYLLSRFTQMNGNGRKAAYLSFSMLSAVVASYSSAMGLAVWMAGLLMLAIHGLKHGRRTGWPLPVWLLAGSIAWLIYFAGFHTPVSPGIFHFLLEPGKVAVYFLAVCGGWFSWNSALSMIAGSLTVSLFLACLFMTYQLDILDESLPWIGTGMFSLFSLSLITVGRYAYGVQEAMSSRYVSLSVLMVVSLYAMLMGLLMHKEVHRAFMSRTIKPMMFATMIMIAISIPLSFFYGYKIGKKDRSLREREACILYDYQSEPRQALAELYPLPQAVSAWAGILQGLDYNVFYYRPHYLDYCERIKPPP